MSHVVCCVSCGFVNNVPEQRLLRQSVAVAVMSSVEVTVHVLSGIAAMLCCVGHDFMNSLPGQRQLRCLGIGSVSHVMS